MTGTFEGTSAAWELRRTNPMLDGYFPEEIEEIRGSARIGDRLLIWTQKAADQDRERGKKTPAGVLRPCVVVGIYTYHAWVKLPSGIHDSISWPEYQAYKKSAGRKGKDW